MNYYKHACKCVDYKFLEISQSLDMTSVERKFNNIYCLYSNYFISYNIFVVMFMQYITITVRGSTFTLKQTITSYENYFTYSMFYCM